MVRTCLLLVVMSGAFVPTLVRNAFAASGGTGLWGRRYTSPGITFINDGAHSVAASPDGSKVFVTGVSTGTTSSADYFTIAYDASTGAVLWARRYNGPGNGDDGATSVAASPDGSKVFVTGKSLGTTSGYDYATIAYAA